MLRFLVRSGTVLVLWLGASRLAVAQTDAVRLRSSDGAADQPRLVVTTSTGTENAQVQIDNAILRLPSTAPLGTQDAGNVRYSAGSVLYWNGTSWLTLETTNNGANYIQNQSASAQTGNYWISGTGRVNTNLLFGTAGAALNGTNQGGSIELGPTNSALGEVPFIDFHFGAGVAQDYNARIINQANNRLDFATNSAGIVMTVSGANVGIGQTSPTAHLEITDTSGASLRVGATANAGFEYTRGSGDFYLGGDGSQAGNFFIKNSAGTTVVAINSDAASSFGTNVAIADTLYRNSDVSGNSRLNLYHNTNATNSRAWIELWGNDATRAGELALSGTYIAFRANSTAVGTGTEFMRLQADGTLSVGTTTDSAAALGVVGQATFGASVFAPPGSEPLSTRGGGSGLSLDDRDGVSPRWVMYPSGNLLRFWRSDIGDQVFIDSNGSVGIGTVPGANLHSSGGGLIGLWVQSGTERGIQAESTSSWGIQVNAWNGGAFISDAGAYSCQLATSTGWGMVVVGGAKSVVIPTRQGAAAMYCEESTELWFSDHGTAKLDRGRARVDLDPLFLDAVQIDDKHALQVFVQPLGSIKAPLYVVPGKTGFEVVESDNQTDSVSFTWRVMAKRRWFADDRLKSPATARVLAEDERAALDKMREELLKAGFWPPPPSESKQPALPDDGSKNTDRPPDE